MKKPLQSMYLVAKLMNISIKKNVFFFHFQLKLKGAYGALFCLDFMTSHGSHGTIEYDDDE
jgi:hypothetical protein